ncbi:MAG TPA: tRNA (adenosine(37)-N6)-threonylcarbamoyltransferase complex ATPase subunit type 1 TsaE [Candidatus Aphodomonas merdavium]|nr:tRNA (adenosine(37)-N6)-threonylcarbamoyltransferase complex ATPase subunit type 1 TsaE [Candidatus Aphodomonas merdavium]
MRGRKGLRKRGTGQLLTHDALQTQELGRKLGGLLRAGDVVLLRGDLGAGKTVFARGVAQGLGVSSPVSSPTFTLMHCHDGAVRLNHLDLYRLADENEFYDAGLDEAMDEGAVCLVEWPEKCEGAMPPRRLEVTIEYAQKEGERRIAINPCGGFREIWL